MGDYPPHGPVPGRVPTQGSTKDHWEATEVAGGWNLGVTSAEDGNAGGRIQEDGRVCSKEVEYGCTMNCDMANHGPMQGDVAYARGVGS